MTGRDLIVYILQNHLEDEEVFKDGSLLDFITIEQLAVKFDVGIATARAWEWKGLIRGVRIGDATLYLKDTPDPRRKE